MTLFDSLKIHLVNEDWGLLHSKVLLQEVTVVSLPVLALSIRLHARAIVALGVSPCVVYSSVQSAVHAHQVSLVLVELSPSMDDGSCDV